MKAYIVRLLLPTLCLAMAGFLALEWIDRTLLLDAPQPGYWADTGVWVVIFLGGMVAPLLAMRAVPTQIQALEGTLAIQAGGFFKLLCRGLAIAVVFVLVCKFVNAIVLDQLLELARPEEPWLDGEQWIMGILVGILCYGEPILRARMAAEAGD